jgi:hypothetical protein
LPASIRRGAKASRLFFCAALAQILLTHLHDRQIARLERQLGTAEN